MSLTKKDWRKIAAVCVLVAIGAEVMAYVLGDEEAAFKVAKFIATLAAPFVFVAFAVVAFKPLFGSSRLLVAGLGVSCAIPYLSR